MRIYAVRCFGATPSSGNIAMVIEDGPTEPAARQAFAAKQECPACVFLTPGDVLEADFYYPHARSALCLHATLAAAHVLLARGATPLLKTAITGQLLRLWRSDEATYVVVQRQEVTAVVPDAGRVARLLGDASLVLASAPALASVGSPKLLVEVADSYTLHRLRPLLAEVLTWGREHGVNGIYAWCRVGEYGYEGRNFNHLDAAREDSATGVAAGALAGLLGHGLVLHQGAQLGNPCAIQVELDGDDIRIGGATRLSVC